MLSGEGNARERRWSHDRTHSTLALIFGGKIIACPRWIGRLLAGKNCLEIATRFRFLVFFALFFSSLKYNEQAVKGNKKYLVHRAGKMVSGFCHL